MRLTSINATERRWGQKKATKTVDGYAIQAAAMTRLEALETGCYSTCRTYKQYMSHIGFVALLSDQILRATDETRLYR